MITQHEKINLKDISSPRIVPCVQGDSGRLIVFDLADFTPPVGATATYYVQKPSGLAVYNTATIDGNSVLVDLTAESIAEVGDNYLQIRILDDEEVVTSFDCILAVAPFRGIEAIESGNESNIFDQAVAEAVDDFAERAAEKAAETIETIPADYTTLSNTVTDLKNDFTDYIDYTGFIDLDWVQGGLYAASGLEYNSSNAIRTGYIPVTASESITIINPDARKYSVFQYDSSKGFISRSVSDSVVTGRNITIPSGTSYIRFMISQTSVTPSAAEGFHVESLSNNTKAVITESYLYAADIPAGSDFDDYTMPGNYVVASSSAASNISNIPIAVSGRLTVMTTAISSSTFQLYVTTNGRIYHRCYTSGAWISWLELSSKKDSLTLAHNNSIVVAAESDFDDFMTPGTYRVESGAIAGTISNMPVKNSGRLNVLTLVGSNSVHQWYISAANVWYMRELIHGEWSVWKQVAYVSDIAAVDVNSASKAAYNAMQALIANSTYNIAFANAFTPLTLQNYIYNTENVHPKVLYFSNGFGGHKYWMAYTPYPRSNDVYENPCIAYSEDGYNWTNIANNPLDEPSNGGYNSDTHIVYNSSTSKLECWYRYVGAATQSPREETIYRQTSSDGLTWSAKELVYSNTSGEYAKLLSPSVIIENSKYCIWVVNNNDSYKIDYYEAPVSDVTNWTKIRSISFSITDEGVTVKPWHIDVIKDGSTYVILMMCRNGTGLDNNICSLFITTSSDNTTYTTPVRVVKGADNWDKYMYRSSIVKVESKYRIYYSAGSGGDTTIYHNARWGIGITESDTLTSGYVGKYE